MYMPSALSLGKEYIGVLEVFAPTVTNYIMYIHKETITRINNMKHYRRYNKVYKFIWSNIIEGLKQIFASETQQDLFCRMPNKTALSTYSC